MKMHCVVLLVPRHIYVQLGLCPKQTLMLSNSPSVCDPGNSKMDDGISTYFEESPSQLHGPLFLKVVNSVESERERMEEANHSVSFEEASTESPLPTQSEHGADIPDEDDDVSHLGPSADSQIEVADCNTSADSDKGLTQNHVLLLLQPQTEDMGRNEGWVCLNSVNGVYDTHSIICADNSISVCSEFQEVDDGISATIDQSSSQHPQPILLDSTAGSQTGNEEATEHSAENSNDTYIAVVNVENGKRVITTYRAIPTASGTSTSTLNEKYKPPISGPQQNPGSSNTHMYPVNSPKVPTTDDAVYPRRCPLCNREALNEAVFRCHIGYCAAKLGSRRAQRRDVPLRSRQAQRPDVPLRKIAPAVPAKDICNADSDRAATNQLAKGNDYVEPEGKRSCDNSQSASSSDTFPANEVLKPWCCGPCDQRFPTKSLLVCHMKYCAAYEASKNSAVRYSKTCTACNRTYSSLQSFSNHMSICKRIENKKPLITYPRLCPKCNIAYQTRHAFWKHKKKCGEHKVSSNPSLYPRVCPLCSRTCLTKQSFYFHKRTCYIGNPQRARHQMQHFSTKVPEANFLSEGASRNRPVVSEGSVEVFEKPKEYIPVTLGPQKKLKFFCVKKPSL